MFFIKETDPSCSNYLQAYTSSAHHNVHLRYLRFASTLLALAAPPPVLADAAPPTLLARTALPIVLANPAPPTLFALAAAPFVGANTTDLHSLRSVDRASWTTQISVISVAKFLPPKATQKLPIPPLIVRTTL